VPERKQISFALALESGPGTGAAGRLDDPLVVASAQPQCVTDRFGQRTEAESGGLRAAEVDLGSVLVYDDAGPLPACRAPGPEEPARHKLLDLIGDLALHGGPPVGSVTAFAPGHTATHAVLARALGSGILEVRPAS